jgi:glycerophosphoryl diester phosphodiesterase
MCSTSGRKGYALEERPFGAMNNKSIRPIPLPVSVFAHRGASGCKPQNTLEAFKIALDTGINGIELDVHFDNNRLLVYHDIEIVTEHRNNNLHIPTLNEVFDLVNNKAVINIELKGYGTSEPVVNLINSCFMEKGWSYSSYILSSFKYDLLKQARNMSEEIPIALLIKNDFDDSYFEIANDLKAFSLNISRQLATKGLIDRIHNRNYKVFVYTINEISEMNKMKEIGADGYFTNYPDKSLTLL